VYMVHQLKMYMRFAQWYGMALGSLLKISILPLQKRKLKTIQIAPKKPVIKNSKTHTISCSRYTSSHEHGEMLQQRINGYTLIVVPEQSLIDEVVSLLADIPQQDIAVWHSELSVKEQFETWLRIRNGEVRVIVGTRGVVFLPFFHLDTVIVDYEERENHKHWDQTPRFHVKDVVSMFPSIYGAAIEYVSYSPSISSYYGVHKRSWDGTHFSVDPFANPPTLVNMKNERKGGNYRILSDVVMDAVLSTTEDVFLYIPRKGDATAVHCQDCGYISICPSCSLPLIYYKKQKQLRCHYCSVYDPMIVQCPACQSLAISLSGVGTNAVVEELVASGIDATTIYHIDGNTGAVDFMSSEGRRIIVGTSRAFSYVRWQQTSVISFLSLGLQLARPERTANEQVWHEIQRAQFYREPTSAFFIQTFDPYHLVVRSLCEPERFYRMDLFFRKGLEQPPYTYVARYFYGDTDFLLAKQGAMRMYEQLCHQLTTHQKTITLTMPIVMHPQFFRRKFWFVMRATFQPDTWQEDLVWLNQFFPATWRIDPRPHSLLSP